MKRTIASILLLLGALAPFAKAQDANLRRQIDEALQYTDEFLDTVKVVNSSIVNDYAMVGVNYGVTFSRMLFNPSKSQSTRLSRDYCSVMFTKYGKMFGYMPYFGIAAGVAHGYEGFLTAVNKETGSNTSIEYIVDGLRLPATEVWYEVVEVPFLAEFHYDMEYLKLIADAGIYGGWRYRVRRGSEYSFSDAFENEFQDYENKFDYGLQGGLAVAFVLDPLELRLGAGLRYSWSSIYKADYNDPVYYRFAYPFDFIVSAGLYIHLGRRRGRTVSDIKREAYEIVYGKN